MKTVIKFLLALFVLSVMPTTCVVAQVGHIETPLERKARQERESTARKKRQQQEAARRKREQAVREEERKQREEVARQQAAREAEERRQREEEEARKRREEEERMRPFLRELEANMVYVEGGTFMMGATSEQGTDAAIDEKPAHQITLSSFYICKYEVTQDLWQAVMGSNPSFSTGSRRPVEKVSWEDCQTFIAKLNQITGKNYRLPTEAEWEYAARGGNRSQGYKYAGGNVIADVAWYDGNSRKQMHDVGTKRANELGLYDMAGNVWEWCQDWYANYNSDSQTNPHGASSGSERVFRGGSRYGYASDCRVTYRSGRSPEFRRYDLGLRLAL